MKLRLRHRLREWLWPQQAGQMTLAIAATKRHDEHLKSIQEDLYKLRREIWELQDMNSVYERRINNLQGRVMQLELNAGTYQVAQGDKTDE